MKIKLTLILLTSTCSFNDFKDLNIALSVSLFINILYDPYQTPSPPPFSHPSLPSNQFEITLPSYNMWFALTPFQTLLLHPFQHHHHHHHHALVDNTIWHPHHFLLSVSNYIFWNDLEFRFHTKSMLCYIILENPLVLFYLLLPHLWNFNPFY